MLERAEMRDAWLATLLPVAVAGLLLLVLLILRQRRRRTTSLDSLFRARRMPDLRQGWRDVIAAHSRRRAERREEYRAAVQAAEDEQARATALATAREEARVQWMAARRIVGPNGQTIIEANQRIRVRTRHGESIGAIVDITDEGLTLSEWTPRKGPGLRWADVQDISVRVGRERRLAIPVTLGAIGAFLLGALGRVIDSFSHSSAGSIDATTWGLAAGGAVGGILGLLIMFAVSDARWRKIIEAPTGAAPLTRSELAARATETTATNAGAVDRPWESVDTMATAAQVTLIVMTLMVLAMCAG